MILLSNLSCSGIHGIDLKDFAPLQLSDPSDFPDCYLIKVIFSSIKLQNKNPFFFGHYNPGC